MTKISSPLGNKFNKEDLEQTKQTNIVLEGESAILSVREKQSMWGRFVSLFKFKKKSKITEEFRDQLDSDYSSPLDQNALLEERPTTNMEKIHFIIGHGIICPKLR